MRLANLNFDRNSYFYQCGDSRCCSECTALADLKEDVINLIRIDDRVCVDGDRGVIVMLGVYPFVPQSPQATAPPVSILIIISQG